MPDQQPDQQRVILEVLYTWDKHFQGKDSWSSYLHIRNAFVNACFNSEGQLKDKYKIKSHDGPKPVQKKQNDLQNDLQEAYIYFIDRVDMMQTTTKANFDDIKANAAMINNNTQLLYDGEEPQFA